MMGFLLLAVALVVVGAWQHEALGYLLHLWSERQEFSHGPLLPLIAAWLLWRKRAVLAVDRTPSALWGAGIVALGSVVVMLGDLSSLMAIIHYGFVTMLCGLVIAWIGPRSARQVWLAFALLFAAIPPPNFILNNLSTELQLLSSSLGLIIMRAFGISVFVEGNVIDLGEHKLEVAAACDGLRYLFPLITLAFMMAYFYRTVWWKRAIVFAASIPLAILMNGLRVGTIGVLVENYGMGMAEGFFHEFQGWLMFMLSAAVLLAIVALLSRIGPDRGPWRERFGMESETAPSAVDSLRQLLGTRTLSTGLTVASACAIAIAVVGLALPQRVEALQPRASLTEFPMRFADWQGRRDTLDEIYIRELKFDDYVLADYHGAESAVNFYVAYYDSQRKGESAHSPRSCIPGGGWEITSLSSGVLNVDNTALPYNRVVIEKGEHKQVVYYWFAQRGRVITNEYLVKWYIFWDSLTRNRTDGAMIRLVAAQRPGQSEQDVDRALQSFAREVAPRLRAYVPG